MCFFVGGFILANNTSTDLFFSPSIHGILVHQSFGSIKFAREKACLSISFIDVHKSKSRTTYHSCHVEIYLSH
jgi:hypothetical protein